MIGYINQIDSLNRLTAQQKEIIADVTQKYNAASRQISNLSEEKKNLTKPAGRPAKYHTLRHQLQSSDLHNIHVPIYAQASVFLYKCSSSRINVLEDQNNVHLHHFVSKQHPV